MAPRYCVVFGVKDTADRYLPLGEFYLRGAEIEEAKSIFSKLPEKEGTGNFVFRLFERYYDKHTKLDINYKKSEYTRETSLQGFHKILDVLIKLEEASLEA